MEQGIDYAYVNDISMGWSRGRLHVCERHEHRVEQGIDYAFV